MSIHLFLTTILLFSFYSAFPQSKQPKIIGVKDATLIIKQKKTPNGSQYKLNIIRKEKYDVNIHPVYLGRTANPYLMSDKCNTTLSFNINSGTIAYTANSDNSGFSGNGVTTYFSASPFLSFDSIQPWQVPDTLLNARFPSGVIYNPAGNTNPDETYIVSTGSLFSSEMDGAFYSSQKFDGSNLDQQFTLFSNDTAGGNGYLNRSPGYDLQARGDKFFALGDSHEDNGINLTKIRTIVNRGIWQGTGVQWTHDTICPAFIKNDNGYPQGFGKSALTMFDDGNSGYLVYTGRNPDATDTTTFQPMIFSTNDGCITWTKENFNWNSIPLISNITNSISPVNRPFFSEPLDAVIDNNSFLHVCFFIYGAVSDQTDSLNYYALYNSWKGFVVDVYETATGWDAFVVDTVFSKDAVDFPYPGITMDERFQMATTQERSIIFYSWAETDPLIDTLNKHPDLITVRYNVPSGLLTEKMNSTKNTEFDGVCYWMTFSDFACYENNGAVSFFAVVSDFGASDTCPVNHYFFSDNIFESISGNEIDPNIIVYPNPATTEIRIEIQKEYKSENSFTIFNTQDQIVRNFKPNNLNTTIDISELPQGIYFISVNGKDFTRYGKFVKL